MSRCFQIEGLLGKFQLGLFFQMCPVVRSVRHWFWSLIKFIMPLLRIQIDLDSYEVKQQETRSRKQKTGSRRQRQKTGSRRQKIKRGSKDKRQDLEGGEWGGKWGEGLLGEELGERWKVMLCVWERRDKGDSSSTDWFLSRLIDQLIDLTFDFQQINSGPKGEAKLYANSSPVA